jgi:hypothetical protein
MHLENDLGSGVTNGLGSGLTNCFPCAFPAKAQLVAGSWYHIIQQVMCNSCRQGSAYHRPFVQRMVDGRSFLRRSGWCPEMQPVPRSRSLEGMSVMKTKSPHTVFQPHTQTGLRLDGGEGDARTIASLRAALAAFQGRHPFQNYTKQGCAHRGIGQGSGILQVLSPTLAAAWDSGSPVDKCSVCSCCDATSAADAGSLAW